MSRSFVQKSNRSPIETVEKHYGFPVLDSKIFERRETSKAIERLKEVGDLVIPDPISILDYEPNSPAAEEFKNLAKEVMQLARI